MSGYPAAVLCLTIKDFLEGGQIKRLDSGHLWTCGLANSPQAFNTTTYGYLSGEKAGRHGLLQREVGLWQPHLLSEETGPPHGYPAQAESFHWLDQAVRGASVPLIFST